jgi:hypothetical protein
MKKAKLILGILCGIIVVGAVAWQIIANVLNHQHSQWLERSVEAVRSLSTETNWIADAIESMHANPKDELGRHFISPDLVVMTNGEWIVCRAATHKQGTQFPELFVGYASDRRWYYSTYHFCNQMMVLGFDGQPPCLSEFVSKYSLAAYSGESYQTLKSTWPTEE